MSEEKTVPFEPGDGRLKVLWLDDLYSEIAPSRDECTETLAPWISLTCVDGPQDIQRLEANGGRKNGIGMEAHDYSVKGLPFDVYLTDFRICDKKEFCHERAHLAVGLHAPSAGFLIVLLTAFRWPQHPQCIIPYSGYDEEFGQIWKLLESFCPPGVHVLWDESVTKGNRNQAELIRLIAPEYRRTLERSLSTGILHLPFAERNRWERILSTGEKVSAHEKLVLVSEFGRRPFLMGALFLDQKGKDANNEHFVPTQSVRGWLARIPLADPVETRARRLAELFWFLRWSSYSRGIYRIIRYQRKGKGEPVINFPWLCNWKQDANKAGYQPVRLAILLLLLREYSMRVLPRRGLRASTSHLLETMRQVQGDYETVEELIEELQKAADKGGQTEKLREAFTEIADWNASVAPGELSLPESTESMTELTEADVVQLLDPMPDKYDVKLSLGRDSKVGKELTRLKPPLDVRELLKGDGSQLSPAEILVARRYARELMPSEQDWPLWLGATER